MGPAMSHRPPRWILPLDVCLRCKSGPICSGRKVKRALLILRSISWKAYSNMPVACRFRLALHPNGSECGPNRTRIFYFFFSPFSRVQKNPFGAIIAPLDHNGSQGKTRQGMTLFQTVKTKARFHACKHFVCVLSFGF